MNYGGQKHLRIRHSISGRPSHRKTGSTKNYSYSNEDNIDDVGARIMYLLHYKGVKLMDSKKKFDIKYATTNHTPGTYICNYPGMEYLYFTKAHRRSMARVVWECSHHICEIMCPGNTEALLNYVAVSL